MKTTMRLLLMAVLTGCLGLGVAACSDSDNDTTDNRVVTEGGKTYVPDSLLTDEEQYQMVAANVAACVVRNLTGKDVSLDELAGKTYEPAYGLTLDGESSMVRIKQVHSTDDAEDLFRDLTGIYDDYAERLLTPTPDGYELSLRDLPVLEGGKRFTLGTLMFHRDGGNRYGYVEVNIPCIPHLERIDYLSAEAMPDNANSPYQLGDVVLVNHDATGYCGGYYLCVATTAYQSTLVHLCLGELGGDETVNFDDDKDGCWVPYNGVKKNDKTTLEDIKAYIYYLVGNQAKVNTIKAFMRGEALDMKPIEPNKISDLFPGGFNTDTEGVAFDNTGSAHTGGYILYDAYYGNYHAGYAYYYRHCIYASIPNRCTSGNQVERKEYKYVADSDWRKSWTGYDNFCMNVIHTDKLINGAILELNATKTLEFGVPAKAATTEQLGWCYADDGYLYETADKARKYGHKPLGIVAFVNTGKEAWMDLASEKADGFGHGLVLSYNFANDGKICLMNPKGEAYFDDYSGFDQFVANNMESAKGDFDGLFRTQELARKGSPAAKAAIDMRPMAPTGTSEWFIPTTGQWLAMLCNDRKGGLSGLGNAQWSKDASETATDDTGFIIRNSDDWNTFRRMIDEAKGNRRINATLAADISTVYTAALNNWWSGTFNGNGHTITVNISGGSLEGIALFRYAKDFTIKNLHVAGKITGAIHTAGLVGISNVDNSANRNNIENCRVSATIESSGWMAGGFIGRGNYADIKNCLFDGYIGCSQNKAGGTTQWWVGAFYGFLDGNLAGCVQNSLERGSYKNGTEHIHFNTKPWTSWGNGENQWNRNNWSYSNLPYTNNANAVAMETMLNDLGRDNWMVDANGKVVPRMFDESVNPWHTGSNVSVGGNPIATIEKYAPNVFGSQDVWTSSANSATIGVWMSTYYKEPYFSWQGDVAKECYVLPVFAF